MSLFISRYNYRSRYLNKTIILKDGKCVLYVMSRDQRITDNYALNLAQEYALEYKLPLAVVFVLSDQIAPNRAKEHFNFMLNGLQELETNLNKLNIPFILLLGAHLERLEAFIAHTKPKLLVVDFNPLEASIKWQNSISKLVPTIQVDTHNSVPAWIVSEKQEIGARTLRPKLYKKLDEYINYGDSHKVIRHPFKWPGKVLKIANLKQESLKIINSYQSNNINYNFESGESFAQKHFNDFINTKLAGYSDKRNNPTLDFQSNLSPYLHFGQISSMYIYNKLKDWLKLNPSHQADVNAFIEELLVRKELSDNFCYYNKNYKSLKGAPIWAQNTLNKHIQDERPYLYNTEQLLTAKTHDNAWNASQKQLIKTGKIHGYMRMYWAKKVLEWSKNPDEALNTLIFFNDFYSIDGGDPNGYAGILWSVAGLHDRPWGERPIYGTVRSMVYGGLKRKFDVVKYEHNWGF